MANSLNDYYDLIFWINYFVYLSYFLIKYILAPILWGVLECADKKERDGERTCLGRFARVTEPMQKLVLLIFGKQLAVKRLERVDINNVHVFTLRKRKLSYGAIMVLFVLLATFAVLAVGSALDITLLSVTHICSEDPEIDCYPQLIRGADNTGLNISTDEPILDCTFWNSDGVSERVTFVCYQFVFSVELFLAVIGGLLAFFIYAIKTTIAVLLLIAVCCLAGCERGGNGESRCKKCVCGFRIIVAIFVSLIEIGVAIVCLVLGANGSNVDSVDDDPGVTFLAMHASEVLVVFGIIATLLWLPWEEYTRPNPEVVNGAARNNIEMKTKT